MQSEILDDFVSLPAGYAVLDSLPYPIIIIDNNNFFVWINHAAEIFFNSSLAILNGSSAEEYFTSNSVLIKMISRARLTKSSLSEHSVGITAPRLKETIVNIQVGLLDANDEFIVISLQKNTLEQVAKSRNLFKGAALSLSLIHI